MGEQGINSIQAKRINLSSKKIKKIVKIPVGASGDVFTLKDYEEYINNYCADFVLVARGAIGNPWIFFEKKLYTFS